MVGKEQFADINRILNQRLEEKKILIAVHQGTSGGNIVGNTKEAFVLALRMGGDMFECDLAQSADGILYVFHDGKERWRLKKWSNIKTMFSKEIDSLEYYNGGGDASRRHVQRFEEVLAYFNHGELFNIDRCWHALPELDAVMRKYPHALRQAVIKTPVEAKYLEFFQNCSEKYMYMPIARSMDEVRKVLSYDHINVVGVEAIASSADSEMFREENIQWMKEQNLYVWTNAITLSLHERHILCAGYDDDRSLFQGPEAGWGVLMDKGYNVMQTDWPWQLSQYRKERLGV